MLKNLTILALAGALLPACIITDGSTDTNVTLETSTTGGTAEATIGGTTVGTTDGSDATTVTGSGTTEAVPTTGEAPTSTTVEATTGEATTGTTGPASDYGMCGWNATELYYGCADKGAAPGVEDPAGIDPIGCPDTAIEGEPCSDDNGPVTNVGCCAKNGDNFYCEAGKIVASACGA